jgi:hypothetical protein
MCVAFGLGTFGVLGFEADRTRQWLLLLTLAYFILLHGMTLARPRFLLPVAALLSVYAGEVIVRGLTRSGSTRRSRP